MTDLISAQAQTGYSSRLTISIPFSIANSGTVSTTIELPVGATLNAIIFPIAFTGATVGFNGSNDGQNFYPMCDPITGSPLSLTVPLTLTSGAWTAVTPPTLCSARFIQLTCSAQGAARSLQAIPRVFA